jgi:hypothetical protein
MPQDVPASGVRCSVSEGVALSTGEISMYGYENASAVGGEKSSSTPQHVHVGDSESRQGLARIDRA